MLAGTFEFVARRENYDRLLADPNLREVLGGTALFSVGLVVFTSRLALVLAILLNQRLRGTTFFRTVFFSPVVVSLVAWTIVWQFLLQDDGGLNGLLATAGVDGPNWLRRASGHGDGSRWSSSRSSRTSASTWCCSWPPSRGCRPSSTRRRAGTAPGPGPASCGSPSP
ncbi:sugar ABC transporter permease [Streptosporangium vulgare]|uniref:carbohydrate ABC transporter permease n=1 Tax=Streptosporangium vulgare TaxID=46190 RepID=UPI0031D6DAF9